MNYTVTFSTTVQSDDASLSIVAILVNFYRNLPRISFGECIHNLMLGMEMRQMRTVKKLRETTITSRFMSRTLR